MRGQIAIRWLCSQTVVVYGLTSYIVSDRGINTMLNMQDLVGTLMQSVLADLRAKAASSMPSAVVV